MTREENLICTQGFPYTMVLGGFVVCICTHFLQKSIVSLQKLYNYFSPLSNLTCSGNGDCTSCSTCKCACLPGESEPDCERYSGDFCECNTKSCDRKYGLLCAGKIHQKGMQRIFLHNSLLDRVPKSTKVKIIMLSSTQKVQQFIKANSLDSYYSQTRTNSWVPLIVRQVF